MILRFKEYINRNRLFSIESKILAAVSGGLDSVCLCMLLKESGYDFAIAHCNFQLRGRESDEDEKFVRELGRKLNVEVYSTSFDTLNYAARAGISTQMAARELRYEWFSAIRKKGNYDVIATAHHRSDIAETVLLNLTKGTGIAGLHGIKEKTGTLVRPLLFAGREEIYQFAIEKKFQWREDVSNESTKYQRNLIRIKVIPELKKINPSFEETLQVSIEKLRAVEGIFRKEVENFKKAVVDKKDENTCYLNIGKIKEAPDFLIKLYEVLREYEFGYDQTKDIVQALDAQSGKIFESKNFTVVKDRICLILTRKSFSDERDYEISDLNGQLSLPEFELEYCIKKAESYTVSPDKNMAALDLSKLKFPVKVRLWQPGDKMKPLGMSQYKKVSDILIDNKVPLTEKKRVYVLESGGDIIWVPGHRIDDRYKLTKESGEVWEARYKRRNKLV